MNHANEDGAGGKVVDEASTVLYRGLVKAEPDEEDEDEEGEERGLGHPVPDL